MGRDKALLLVGGQPLAARSAWALGAAGAEPVIAVGGDDAALAAIGLRVVPDLYPGEGPLGGLLTAFDALADHELAVVVATDLPGITPESFVTLVDSLGEDDATFAAGDRLEPLCAVWRVATCRLVLGRAFSDGERAVHRAVRPLRHHTVALAAAALRNVNEPDDLGR